MKTTLVLFAVTMFTSMTITAADVPLREEQYRAKYGRYTPAFEAQRRANPATATDEIATPDCCRTLRAAQSQNAIAEEFKRAKYGRKSPAGEAQALASKEEVAAHAFTCRTLHHCPLPPVTAAIPSRQAEPCEHACCQVAE